MRLDDKDLEKLVSYIYIVCKRKFYFLTAEEIEDCTYHAVMKFIEVYKDSKKNYFSVRDFNHAKNILRRILINFVIDLLRKNGRRGKIISLEDGIHAGDDSTGLIKDNLCSPEKNQPEVSIIKKEDTVFVKQMIEQALSGVKSKYRVVLLFCYYLNFSIVEISFILGVKRQVVDTRLSRAKNILACLLLKHPVWKDYVIDNYKPDAIAEKIMTNIKLEKFYKKLLMLSYFSGKNTKDICVLLEIAENQYTEYLPEAKNLLFTTIQNPYYKTFLQMWFIKKETEEEL